MFFSGCTNSNSSLKRLKSNHKLYERLGNCTAVITKSATVYIETLPAKKIKVLINSRDREKDIYLSKCKIDKKEVNIVPVHDNYPFNINWLKSYKISSHFLNNKKQAVLECELSNGEKFSKILFQ